MKKLVLILMVLVCSSSYAAHFGKKATYSVCFTPGANCEQIIINELTGAADTIRMQAYQLTDSDILSALTKAKERGVDIQIILDKSQVNDKKTGESAANYLKAQKIPVWIDGKPAIAHNKVILIDDNIVMTGSFNYSENAQNRNAENLISIIDRNLYRVYFKNFEKRRNESKKY